VVSISLSFHLTGSRKAGHDTTGHVPFVDLICVFICGICLCVQVLYNYAYALHVSGEVGVAKEKLEVAKTQAGSTSESRHKIITAALDTIRVRGRGGGGKTRCKL